jgi:hypothetical protein
MNAQLTLIGALVTACLSGLAPVRPLDAPPAGRAEQAPPETGAGMHRVLDEVLDLYVRDGFVYYRALESDRQRLDGYIASLDVPAVRYDGWSKSDQAAFWLNAYNAFVLRTVIDRYPIQSRSGAYPANSIRQIGGAFEALRRRAAGRSVTLDQIEREILPAFGDPRMFIALGRGAVGSGRLRSEAYAGQRLEAQLADAAQEFSRRERHVRVDDLGNQLAVSAIFSWREREFVAGYADRAPAAFARRSPIERAILAFIDPYLLPMEREFIQGNRFKVAFQNFDWRLNDLTGGRTD